MIEPRVPVSLSPNPGHDAARSPRLPVTELKQPASGNGHPVALSDHAADATERTPARGAGSPDASANSQQERPWIGFLRWSTAAVLAVPFLFLLLSRVLLPCWVAVSREAWTQAEQTEVRAPFSVTSIACLPALHTEVAKDELLCRIFNALPDLREVRELSQQQANLRASLMELEKQFKAVELQRGETSASWTAYVDFSRQSLAAAVDRASAELAAAGAEYENAVETLELNERLVASISATERNASRLRVQLATQQIKALEADLRRLAAEDAALERRVPRDTPDLPARQAALELRCVELRGRQAETELQLTAVDARRQAAQEAVDQRTAQDLYAPCAGRITWVNAADVVPANEPLLRIAQPVSLVESLFAKANADRVFPGQPVVIALSTGEELAGRIQAFVEPSATLPNRTMNVPRQADQMRVLIRLDAGSNPPTLLAGVPVSVAVCDWPSVAVLMSNRLSRWALYAAVWLTLLVLAIKAVLSQVCRPPSPQRNRASADGRPKP